MPDVLPLLVSRSSFKQTVGKAAGLLLAVAACRSTASPGAEGQPSASNSTPGAPSGLGYSNLPPEPAASQPPSVLPESSAVAAPRSAACAGVGPASCPVAPGTLAELCAKATGCVRDASGYVDL